MERRERPPAADPAEAFIDTRVIDRQWHNCGQWRRGWKRRRWGRRWAYCALLFLQHVCRPDHGRRQQRRVGRGRGPIYTAPSGKTATLLVDNGGFVGTNTPVSAALGAPSSAFNLTVQNGGVVSPQASTSLPTLASLLVASNWYLTGVSGSMLDIVVTGNAEINLAVT